MEMIEFEGQQYLSMLIDMPFGRRRISTEELNNRLMDMEGNYVSENARLVDEAIFYFLPKDKFLLKKNAIVQLILSEI